MICIYTEKIKMFKFCTKIIHSNYGVCSVDLSCADGRINDVDHHIKTKKHKEYEKNLQM